MGLEPFTSHSLRRGGATAMFDAKFSLIDIKNLGDWKSMSVARYLLCSLDSKIELNMEVSDKLFNPFNPIRPYLASIEPLPII